jgi:uncharacterized DUF497 family protein
LFDNQTVCNYNVIIGEFQFEWNNRKNALNKKKHNVAFEEAITVFLDEHYLEIDDPDHSDDDEERFLAMGISRNYRLLIVCHCFREGERVIRIISARNVTTIEAKQYGGLTNAKRI